MLDQTIAASDPNRTTAEASRAAALIPALATAFLGAFLIWGVGFSHIDVFHNAAHDTRHSNAFPCH
ncbi:CbtB domain-containing protein [Azospirillum canadense]|uniref:CbtB domain-containing protein n=1 Tax=Azospirillum canadense TaxID=403962 RepID=UPI002227B7E8|nr:CbtB-domain containing protein [Azospirillum canadense]MCW2240438.1 cobalt transporter subunit CbtB [Azospirillum canadense]